MNGVYYAHTLWSDEMATRRNMVGKETLEILLMQCPKTRSRVVIDMFDMNVDILGLSKRVSGETAPPPLGLVSFLGLLTEFAFRFGCLTKSRQHFLGGHLHPVWAKQPWPSSHMDPYGGWLPKLSGVANDHWAWKPPMECKCTMFHYFASGEGDDTVDGSLNWDVFVHVAADGMLGNYAFSLVYPKSCHAMLNCDRSIFWEQHFGFSHNCLSSYCMLHIAQQAVVWCEHPTLNTSCI